MQGDDSTHWAPFVGKSDATKVPNSGSLTFTPTTAGQTIVIIRAYRRSHDLNGDGEPDGKRRSVQAKFTINVSP
jgi:hypothetical protein